LFRLCKKVALTVIANSIRKKQMIAEQNFALRTKIS